MGKTITEKILARAAARKEVSPGQYIEVSSRCPTPMGNFGGLQRGLEFCVEWEVGVFNPQLIRIIDGHLGARLPIMLPGLVTRRDNGRKQSVSRRKIFTRLGEAVLKA